MTYQQNPDRVTPPVAVGAGVGFVIAAIAKAVLDLEVDPGEAEAWWNVATTVVFPALAGIGAAVAARFKARNDVSPIRIDKGDTPRDQHGNALAPISPTRAARPEERRRPPFDGP
jgi:hypothetical protein